MSKKSKNNSAIAILVISIGVLLVGSVLVYSYLRAANTPQYFNASKKGKAEKLYNGIMAWELDNNYPGSPEEVMEIYNDTIILVYGDMVRDETVMGNIIEQQRKLLTPRLIEDNSFEEQMRVLGEALEILGNDGVYCIGTEQKTTIYDPAATDRCVIRVVYMFAGMEDMHRNYYFIRNPDNRHWQIDEWELTDEHFRSVTE